MSLNQRTIEEIVAEVTHGEFNPDLVVRATRIIAELTQYLNHATRHPNVDDTLAWPITTADVIGALRETFEAIPQLLDQLADRERAYVNDPRLVSDKCLDGCTDRCVDGCTDECVCKCVDRCIDGCVLAEYTATTLMRIASTVEQLGEDFRLAHKWANRLYLNDSVPFSAS